MGVEERLLSENIVSELDRADRAVLHYIELIDRHGGEPEDPEDDSVELANLQFSQSVRKALRCISALSERMGITSVRDEASLLLSDKKSYLNIVTELDPHFERYSPVSVQVHELYHPLKTMLNPADLTTHGVLRSILERTAMIVAEKEKPPSKEADIRNAVFDVCAHAFGEAQKEVKLNAGYRQYRGDIGIPSLRAVVEFKFASSKEDMKKSLDDVYSDMKTYRDPNWDTFYSVFYLTSAVSHQGAVDKEYKAFAAERTWTPIVVVGNGQRTRKNSGKGFEPAKKTPKPSKREDPTNQRAAARKSSR